MSRKSAQKKKIAEVANTLQKEPESAQLLSGDELEGEGLGSNFHLDHLYFKNQYTKEFFYYKLNFTTILKELRNGWLVQSAHARVGPRAATFLKFLLQAELDMLLSDTQWYSVS